MSKEDRALLKKHLEEAHSFEFGFGADSSMASLLDAHEHEHDGPGTIRNHPRTNWTCKNNEWPEETVEEIEAHEKLRQEYEDEFAVKFTDEQDQMLSYAAGHRASSETDTPDFGSISSGELSEDYFRFVVAQQVAAQLRETIKVIVNISTPMVSKSQYASVLDKRAEMIMKYNTPVDYTPK